jgi:hypothetical protein
MLNAEIATALAVAQTAEALLKQLREVTERLKPFRPDVKSFRIDYLGRNSEVKYLLFIPDGVRRKVRRKIEIPAISGFRFDEMWDLDKTELVNFTWGYDGNKWFLDISKLPASEKYWLTIKGKVSNQFLGQLVSVKAAENPCKEGETDKYWIHSALKDVDMLHKIWTELNIEQVNADVRIGVERMFTSAIPREVKERFELQRQLLTAISSGNRDLEQRLRFKYRRSSVTPMISPSELYELLLSLVTGDFFAGFVTVTQPFIMNNVEPIKDLGVLVPEKVKVGVQTDLSYKMPTAKGDLFFQRKQYEESVSDKVKELLPKKKTV